MIRKNALDVAYETFLKDVAAKLVSDGLTRRGRSLRKEFDEGVEIIEFQKSRGSSSKAIIFTVNVGVAFKKQETYAATHKHGEGRHH